MHLKKNLLPSGIRSRMLCIFLSATLIPVIMFGVLVSLSSSKELEEESYKTYRQTANQIGAIFSEYASRTDQTLRSVDNSLAVPQFLRNEIIVTIGLDPDVHFLKDNAYSSLKQLADTNTSIYAISAITLSGDSVSCVDRKRDTFMGNIEDDYYEPLRHSTGNTVVLPIKTSSYKESTPREVFTIGCRYLDTSGYLGYIIAECPTEHFEEFCNFIDLNSEMNVYIMDQKGTLAYTTEKNASYQKNVLTQLKKNPSENRMKTKDGTYILVNVPLSDTGWTIYAVIPYYSVTANSRDMMITFFWLCIVCMLIIVAVTFIISGSFTKPVLTLQQAMKKVSEGDLTVRVLEERYDEFGDLNLGFNQLMDKLDALISDVAEAQIRKDAAEYQMLQSQINPHFLYNTLDTIRMMAVLEDNETIADAILHLSTLFRYHTKQSNRLVSIDEELKQIQNYLYLQKIRFQDNLEVAYQIEKETLQYRMPKILLQPILENSFSHGFHNMTGPYRIQITISKEVDSILFVIKDNGLGMSRETLEYLQENLTTFREDEEHGIGLYNVNKRLHLYFPDTPGLAVASTEGKGTTVSFIIPLLHQESTLFKYDIQKEEQSHEY